MTVAEKEQIKALIKRNGIADSLANLYRKTQGIAQTDVDKKRGKAR